MGFIDLFPTVILQETLNIITDSDINLYKKFIDTENFNDGGREGEYSQNQKFLSNPTFEKINDVILNLSKIYLNEIGHKFEDLQISNSWVNRLNTTESIYAHKHNNSYLSGVFYFEDSSPITFISPHSESYTFSPEFTNTTNSYRKFQDFIIYPKSKQLLLFPSWLYHKILPSQKENRLSIAFNIIPKGEFGGDTGKLYL